MEIATPASAIASVKAAEAKREPWSELKTSGLPNFISASSSAARLKETSIVFDRRQHSPRRPVDDHYEIEKAATDRNIGVSRPKEFHLRPLAEPDVSLSAHPAPIIHPTTDSPSTNGRMRVADVAPAV